MNPERSNKSKIYADFEKSRTSYGMNPERSREGSQRASTSYGMNKFPKLVLVLFILIFGFNALAAATTSGTYSGTDITIQQVFAIIMTLVCWFSDIALVIIVIFIIWYGLKFMRAQGDPGKVTEARKSLTWGIVGILVVLGTYTIIASVAKVIDPNGNYSSWVPINCSASSSSSL